MMSRKPIGKMNQDEVVRPADDRPSVNKELTDEETAAVAGGAGSASGVVVQGSTPPSGPGGINSGPPFHGEYPL